MEHSRKAKGGKAVYGARLGILMLETRFPRIPGDTGNAGPWPFPVLYKVVAGASPERTLRERIGMPVFDIVSFVTWFHAGLCPRDFGHPSSAPRSWGER